MNTPTPAMLANTTRRTEAPALSIQADAATTLPTSADDPRIIRAKALRPGQRVQHFLKGKVVGRARTVAEVGRSRLRDEGVVVVAFEGEEPSEYKAAYRWFDTQAEAVRPGTVEAALRPEAVAALREVTE